MLLLLVLMMIAASAADERDELLKMCRDKYPPQACPGYWYRLDGQRCMSVFRSFAPFDIAETYCKREGGHLISINNLSDYNQVLCMLLRDRYTRNEHWIGAKRSQGKFSWVDGSGPLTFTKWAPGQPDNQQQQDCVVMNYGSWGAWKTLPCSENRLIMCERRG
ncbi:Versican core protein Chondroitin sulfate proteoglycan core protein 2 [Channa argus]|uniref:Versican core protein Chondroitin sulfate proteoglycan core protein 2 n=1 Tax=Channa argus TaxID=215402 RepID=A0A6G1P7B9_CHAAH|nr:Versican core protein Chondroitin sulfate proteoglycan core protein 2 [Channa argus]